jgi:DNA-binding CsgD family transcriptional regulator
VPTLGGYLRAGDRASRLVERLRTRWNWPGGIQRSLRGVGVARPGSRVGALTTREHEVLVHVAAGKTSARIAAELGISATTVDSHVRSAVRKLGARGRHHAALLAIGEAPR